MPRELNIRSSRLVSWIVESGVTAILNIRTATMWTSTRRRHVRIRRRFSICAHESHTIACPSSRFTLHQGRQNTEQAIWTASMASAANKLAPTPRAYVNSAPPSSLSSAISCCCTSCSDETGRSRPPLSKKQHRNHLNR